MSVRVVVIDRGVESKDGMVRASVNSVRAAGEDPYGEGPEDSIKVAQNAGTEYCHFVEAGTLILPHFYEAMITACNFSGVDYAYCQCVRVRNDHSIIETPTPDEFIEGQILVKSWVVSELGIRGQPVDLLKRVLREYKGTEIPYVMALEVSCE